MEGQQEQPIMTYCLRCKEQTPTDDPKIIGYAKPRLVGKCSACQANKSRFVRGGPGGYPA